LLRKSSRRERSLKVTGYLWLLSNNLLWYKKVGKEEREVKGWQRKLIKRKKAKKSTWTRILTS
jgi:hypothetical protein